MDEILKEGRKFFEAYAYSFRAEELKVLRGVDMKKKHMLRVVEITRQLISSMDLTQEQLVVAEIIALFHDIGRFQQFKQYHTFNDLESEDHAALSAEVLKGAEFFTKIDADNQQLILNAIQNHNKIQLPAQENELALKYCMIIRDADKLDNLDLIANQLREKTAEEVKSITLDLPNNLQVTDKVIKSIMQEKSVKKEDLRTVNDFKLMILSWVFDLNLKESYVLLNQSRNLNKIFETLPKQDGILSAYRIVKLYLENKFVHK